MKKRFRKRAGIEAFINHLKLDHRTARNYLKSTAGDEINVRLAGTAFNLMKRMRRYALIFGQFLLIAFFGLDSTQRSNQLEQSLLPDEMRISQNTYSLVKKDIGYEEAGEIQAENRADSELTYRVANSN